MVEKHMQKSRNIFEKAVMLIVTQVKRYGKFQQSKSMRFLNVVSLTPSVKFMLISQLSVSVELKELCLLMPVHL